MCIHECGFLACIYYTDRLFIPSFIVGAKAEIFQKAKLITASLKLSEKFFFGEKSTIQLCKSNFNVGF